MNNAINNFMSQLINFSDLQIASTVSTADQLLIRLNNSLSGTSGFARANVLTFQNGLPLYNAYQSTSGLAITNITASAPLSSTGGKTPTLSISPATTASAGSMTASDKIKLNTIALNSTVSPFTSGTGLSAIKPVFGNNISSGIYSSVLGGVSNVVSGDYGVSAGSNNLVFGLRSTAVGHYNQSGGIGSTSIGNHNTTTNFYGTSVGSYNTASEYCSVAMGTGNTSTEHCSVAIGTGNTASGQYSTALGSDNTATATGAISIGKTNAVSGNYANAFGYSNTAAGDCAVAVGITNTVNSSFAFGLENGSCLGGMAIGWSSSAFNSNALAIGGFNTASGSYAVAIGSSNTVTADSAWAIGSGISNNITGSIMIGPSNTTKITIRSDNGRIGLDTTTPISKFQITTGTLSIPTEDISASTVLTAASKYLQNYTGAGGHTVTLPSCATGNGLTFVIKNVGTGSLTVSRAGGDSIFSSSSVTSVTLAIGEAMTFTVRSSSQWTAY